MEEVGDQLECVKPLKMNYNYNFFKPVVVCEEADRAHLSDAQTASIVNAVFIDLGLITKANQDMTVTRHKIRNARKKIRAQEINQNFSINCGQIRCIGFDGKKSEARTLTEENKRRNLTVDNYTFTNHEGKYLAHSTIKASSTGKNIAQEIIKILNNFESREMVKLKLL